MHHQIFKILVLTITLVITQGHRSACGSNKDKGLEIWADKLSVAYDKREASFEGNVRVHKEDMYLETSIMHVYYSHEKEGQENAISRAGKVEKLHFPKRVKIADKKAQAYGDYGYFFAKKGEFHLHGNVLLKQDMGVVKGDKLIYNIKRKVMFVTSNTKDRVKLLYLGDTD